MHQTTFVGRALSGPAGELAALPQTPSCIKGRDGERNGGQARKGRGGEGKDRRGGRKVERKGMEGMDKRLIGPHF